MEHLANLETSDGGNIIWRLLSVRSWIGILSIITLQRLRTIIIEAFIYQGVHMHESNLENKNKKFQMVAEEEVNIL